MSSKITVGQGVEEYLSYRCARFAATTVKQEGYVLRRFAANVGLHRQVRYLQAKVVSDWFYGAQGVMCKHQTRDRTVRPAVQASTHNYYRSRLKALFLFWARRGYVREELLADVQPAKQLRKQRQQPTPQQLLDMLPSTDDLRDRAYLAALMNTGLRANEVLRLRVEDVDLDGDWLTVLISKSQQEDRLPITLDLAPHLRRWLQRYREDLARALRPEDYLFPAGTGNRFRKVTMANGTTGCINSPPQLCPGRPMTHPERVVHAALARVGLPTRYEGAHTIRRAVARHFFDSLVATDLGYDGALRTVSALLHHSNAATTETYLGLSSERQRRDNRLRRQPFLTALIDRSNVVPFRVQDQA